MSISPTPQLEHLVKTKVESGLYNSAAEVISQALYLLDEQDRLRAMRLDALKAEIQLGIDSGPAAACDFNAVRERCRAWAENRQKENP